MATHRIGSEIFNPDTAPVELGGFGLSDDVDSPLRWFCQR